MNKTPSEATQGASNSSIKDELLANKIIELKGNVSQAYSEVTGCTLESARANAYGYIANNGIRERALEILNQQTGGTLPAILKELAGQTQANKTLVTKRGTIQAPDNPSRLDAIKTCLKMYQVLTDAPQVNQVSINITPADAEAMEAIADKLMTNRERMRAKYKDYDSSAEVIL